MEQTNGESHSLFAGRETEVRMIKARLGLFFGLAMVTSVTFAGTPTGTEILFGSSSFDDVEIGATLTYSHQRSADEKIPVRAIKDGHVTIARIEGDEGKDRTVVALTQGAARRELDHLPADRGNPIFVVFLESSVSSVTFATKGSPFYIRNRIKEAFSSGGDVSEEEIEFNGAKVDATHIEYRPFKGDRNAEKMGAAFENLSIQFTLSDDVPGHFVAMTTQAKIEDKVFFIEEVRFDAVKDAEE